MTEEIKNTVEPQKEEHFRVNKLTFWKTLTGIFAILFIISIATSGFDFGSDSATGAAVKEVAPTAQKRIDVKPLIDDDTVKGDENAPVTIIEWSDFECPFCERFYSQTLGQLEEEYIKTGKVKLVFRDYPLDFHPFALKASEAAECAKDQDKFWDFHDKIFENQQALTSLEKQVQTPEVAGRTIVTLETRTGPVYVDITDVLTQLKGFAKDLGLNTDKFNKCLDSGEKLTEVQKDFADGQKAGISGTPGFIVNGILISGAQPFENFKQVIEAEL